MAGESGQSTASADIPLGVRIMLARAAVQVLAEDAAVEMLHIKGEVVDRRLRVVATTGSDVDALVRPAHVEAMHEALIAHGWRVFSTFELGSPFGHAQTYLHDMWGFFDLHRSFPGIRCDPGKAFEVMWRDRTERELSGARGWVPSLTMQATLLVLNDARDVAVGKDPLATWITTPGLDPDEVAQTVAELGAETAFAAALGTLEDHRAAPDYMLWRSVSQGGSRSSEWWGRMRAAETSRDVARLAVRALLVNVEQLEHDLGRPPTRRDMVRAFVSRQLLGARELGSRLSRRRVR